MYKHTFGVERDCENGEVMNLACALILAEFHPKAIRVILFLRCNDKSSKDDPFSLMCRRKIIILVSQQCMSNSVHSFYRTAIDSFHHLLSVCHFEHQKLGYHFISREVVVVVSADGEGFSSGSCGSVCTHH